LRAGQVAILAGREPRRKRVRVRRMILARAQGGFIVAVIVLSVAARAIRAALPIALL